MSRRPPPSFLPDEVIHLILLKLPVSSLLRFKCVCKSWKTHISNPQFAMEHLHTDTTTPHHHRLASYVYDGLKEIVTCSVQSLNPSTPAPTLTFKMERQYSIIGSINGLICLRESRRYFRLWNPSTRFESETSPRWPPTPFPRFCTHIGFGYDQVNNKYKVLVDAYRDESHVTRVYTFGTDSWTTIQSFPCTEDDDDQRVGKFVSGTLNWLTQSRIISFDVEKETYGEVSIPVPQLTLPRWLDDDYVEGDDYDSDDDGHCLQHYELDVLNDCLCVCYFSKCKHWVVWLMKEYGVHESWTKLLMIPHQKLIISSAHLPAFRPLCILENGLVLAKAANSLLILYNPNNGAWRYVDILGRFGEHIQVYQESLVSP